MASASSWSWVIAIPSEFAARTITREGEAGRTWIDRLPGVVAAYVELVRPQPVAGPSLWSGRFCIPNRGRRRPRAMAGPASDAGPP